MQFDVMNRLALQAKYIDLFERTINPILLIERETFEILDCNDPAMAFFHFGTEIPRGVCLASLFEGSFQGLVTQGLRIARRRYYQRELKAWVKSGSSRRFVCLQLSQLLLANGQFVLQVIMQDITRQLEAEESASRLVTELKVVNAKLEELSATDEMTGLCNFRGFKSILQVEHERAMRLQTRYSILFMDVDNFKHYNDQHGHPAGDQLLRELAQFLRLLVRKIDLLTRYGGEEFVILSFSKPPENVLTFAQRICSAVAAHQFHKGEFQPMGKITLSIGVATYPDHGASADEIIKAADSALYQSKKDGRNRVTIAPISPPKIPC